MKMTRRPSAHRHVLQRPAVLGIYLLTLLPPTVLAQPSDAAHTASGRPVAWFAWVVGLAGLAAGGVAAWWLQERRRRRQLEGLRAELDEAEAGKKELEARQAALAGEVRAKDEELDLFIYRVSHDLRSPLTTILAFGSMLEQDLEDGDADAVREGLLHIDTAAAKLARMLEDLLRLSRSGRAIDQPRPVALADVLRRAEAAVAEKLEARGLQVELTSELPTVTGDADRLQQVFESLIDNAAKFIGEQASPRIEVGRLDGAGAGERAGDGPVIYVRDNGMGIDPADLERVFGLYERLHGDVDGMGVGLALVRRIVEAHGGTVWVESEGAFCGTTVLFRLAATSNES